MYLVIEKDYFGDSVFFETDTREKANQIVDIEKDKKLYVIKASKAYTNDKVNRKVHAMMGNY